MITRRDFLNSTLIGSGASLLSAAPPSAAQTAAPNNDAAWDGPGGVGDYADSHGNPMRVLSAAHRIRDGQYSGEKLEAADTGETFDLIVVGGGMSGLGAAQYFDRGRKAGQTCLVIENHPIFGGESKRNEFIVDGQRIMAPQGANEFDVPTDPDDDAYEIFEQLRIPWKFKYQTWPKKFRPIEFDRTNYGFQHWIHAPSFGHHVGGRWVRDFWNEHAPEDFKKWKFHAERYYSGDDLPRWLDSMTYQAYIENVMGLSPEVTEYAHPILAAAMGLGCDALSAYAAFQIGLPGFKGFKDSSPFPLEHAEVPETGWHMFPGGNTGFARYMVKALVPEAIRGGRNLRDIVNGRIRFDVLDRSKNSVRIRLSATAVRVEQNREHAEVTYEKGGRLYRARARGVVMACGAWVSKHIVADLPAEKREAFSKFFHSPVLVFNVAVRNWRFLYDRGLTSARWTSGFGFSCNIRRQMVMRGYRPKLSPDAPNVVTFYVPLYYPGLPAREQGVKGRTEMFGTSFAEYEQKILDQMRTLFGSSAVDAVAGIILNRWGHAYVNATPGFYFGPNGAPSPPDVVRKPVGRVTFAHSELFGHQFWLGAIREGRRAVDQLRERG